MKYIGGLLFFLILFASCHDDDKPSFSDKTVIIYMAGDNNLEENAYENLNQIEAGLPDNRMNLIVYMDTQDGPPKLLKIKKDGTKEVKSEVLKTYEEHNSVSPQILNKVLSDIISRYQSKSYGLILWSHGTAWIPPRIKTRSFGLDGSKEMDIRDLAIKLPPVFDYIIFDACLMGNVEVAYELKDKTPYILASPLEILSSGMPYESIIPILFKDLSTEKRLKTVGQLFFDFYQVQQGNYRTASISLIKTNELPALAQATRNLFSTLPLLKWEYQYDKIQKLDNNPKTILFDFWDFLEKNYEDGALEEVKQQLNRTILYKAHTDYFLGIYKIKTFCGLSCYVPRKNSYLNSYYRTLRWTEASRFNTLLE